MTNPREIPKIVFLRSKLADDAARLRALWSEHSLEETLDFEDKNVRIILDVPRRNDAAAGEASDLGAELAELIDGGERHRAELVDLLVLMAPLDHLRCMVKSLRSCCDA